MSDLSAWRKQERKEQERVKAEELAERETYAPSYNDGAGGDSGWRTVALIVIIFMLVVFFLAAFILFGRSDAVGLVVTGENCTCVGRPGRDGLDGRDGADGGDGRDGVDGKDGNEGPPGFCEFHPNCLQGPPGLPGTNGRNGTDGVCAQPCIDGLPGERGFPGFNGTNGRDGINGTNGIDGINGIDGADGVCDCFNITDIAFETLTVDNLFVNSTITYGAGACPDLSPCDLAGMSLLLDNGVGGSVLQVGVPQVTTSQDRVYLGNADSPTLHRIKDIRMFAEKTRVVGQNEMQIRATSGGVSLVADGLSGSITGTSTFGTSFSSGAGFTASNSIGGNVLVQNLATGGTTTLSSFALVRVAGETLDVKASSMVWRDSDGTWFENDKVNSYAVNNSAIVTIGGVSTRFHRQIALEPNVTIVSLDSSGEVALGPHLRILGGNIACGTGTCILNSNLVVNGDITSTGDIDGVSGTCCTSDRRAKQDVRPSDTKASLHRVLATPVVEFRYTDAYIRADRRATNQTIRGFIAQDVEREFPHAVTQTKKTVAGELIDDLRQLHTEQMLADLWGAFQELHREVVELRAKLKK